MSDFDYRQRPTTSEYRDNWDRIYSPRPEVSIPSVNSPEGSGLPFVFPICVKCPLCGAAPGEDCINRFTRTAMTNLHDARRQAAQRARVLPHVCRCGNDVFRTDARHKLVCKECGEDLW
jgi:hypothetical protein